MTVRAKFKVRNIQSFSNAGSKITLTPVIADNPENKAFFDATPWGEIVLGTVNEAAAAVFEVDKEFYVDFTPA